MGGNMGVTRVWNLSADHGCDCGGCGTRGEVESDGITARTSSFNRGKGANVLS